MAESRSSLASSSCGQVFQLIPAAVPAAWSGRHVSNNRQVHQFSRHWVSRSQLAGVWVPRCVRPHAVGHWALEGATKCLAHHWVRHDPPAWVSSVSLHLGTRCSPWLSRPEFAGVVHECLLPQFVARAMQWAFPHRVEGFRHRALLVRVAICFSSLHFIVLSTGAANVLVQPCGDCSVRAQCPTMCERTSLNSRARSCVVALTSLPVRASFTSLRPTQHLFHCGFCSSPQCFSGNFLMPLTLFSTCAPTFSLSSLVSSTGVPCLSHS